MRYISGIWKTSHQSAVYTSVAVLTTVCIAAELPQLLLIDHGLLCTGELEKC